MPDFDPEAGSSGPINLQTFGDLIRHGYKLTGFCRQCGVHKDVDLTALAAERLYVGARFKCKACGGRVEITLSQVVTSNSGENPALAKWRER